MPPPTKQICPYYLMRQQTPQADLVLMPYNYLLDAGSRKPYQARGWTDGWIHICICLSCIIKTHTNLPHTHINHEPMQVRWPGSVIVFDEAHNLEGIAADAWSVDISTTLVAGVIQELGRAWESWKAKGEFYFLVVFGWRRCVSCVHI
jgi:Rad3-related DNA helicase